MEKIRLDLDDLQVESFAIDPLLQPARGTVRGEELSGACGSTRIGHCACTAAC